MKNGQITLTEENFDLIFDEKFAGSSSSVIPDKTGLALNDTSFSKAKDGTVPLDRIQ